MLPKLRDAFYLTLLGGIIVHFFNHDWLSGLLLVLTGAAASAYLTIYAIENELFRRRSIAHPALRRVNMRILFLAYRLAFYVARSEDIYTQLRCAIEEFKKSDAPPTIPKKLKERLEEMELKTQPGLSKESLSSIERIVIIRAPTWFLDDIIKAGNGLIAIPQKDALFSPCNRI